MPHSFQAIGTHWQIDLPETLAPERRERLLLAIRARITEFESVYSRFDSASLVSRIAREAGTFTFPPDAAPLFAMYRKFSEFTAGAFTPLIGQVLVDAGYDAAYSLTPKPLIRAPKAWDEVMTWNAPVLTTREPVQLDFGAAGKGYLVDLVGEMLEADGVHDYCVDAGGDIRYRSSVRAPLRVGLENPAHTKQVIGIVALGNMSLCGSAGNRRAWAGYHHTINPHTLASPKHLQAVWVVAGATLLADALTTALQFVSASELRLAFDFEYLLLREDFSVEHSSGFPAELFTA